MSSKQKLELMWVGKEKRAKLEPRILIEDPEKSYHADKRVSDNDIFDNMLIHGDNLLALKALEQDYAGRVKCIYIDPPYNTGNAFEFYDDGLEVSIWLGLMRERLDLLKSLLAVDGCIFVQIDDNYLAHLKLIMDEVFGKSSFINLITVKTKNSSGASGGGEDRRLKKNTEFILVYGKQDFLSFNPVYSEVEFGEYMDAMKVQEKSFKYTTVLFSISGKEYFKTIKDGSGNDIKIYKITSYKTKSIQSLKKEENASELDIITKYCDRIFTTENAQTSIRTRVQEATDEENNMYSIEYYPISGRNKGKLTELYFLGPKKRLVSFLSNVVVKRNGTLYKREKIGTLWDKINWNNVTREAVRFPNGQKPELLIEQVLNLATNPGDLVLDSFLGSGTTAAVAHKMGRRWIGIELGEHCNTHCVPRLKKVIDGEDAGGITKSANWRGGGGFRYYNLAPSLVKFDEWGNPVINKEFNENMLVRALCKVEGFNFDPSPDVYWKQGKSTESDFIYVTTQHLTAQMLQKLSDDVGENCTLLICCGSFDGKKDSYGNLTIKKIPKAILKKCEWNHDDYSLEIKNLPMSAPDPQPSPAPRKKSLKKQQDNNQQMNLFGEVE